MEKNKKVNDYYDKPLLFMEDNSKLDSTERTAKFIFCIKQDNFRIVLTYCERGR